MRPFGYFLVFLFCILPLKTSFAQDQQAFNALLSKAAALAAQGDHNEAKMVYRQAHTLNKEAVEPLIGLGEIATSEKKWSEAQSWFRQIQKLDPENPAARSYFDDNRELHERIARGNEFLAAGTFGQAEREFHTALEMNSQSLAALKGLGKIAAQKEEWQESRKYFNQVLSLEPNDLEAQHFVQNPQIERNLQQADSLVALRKLKDAKDLYESVLFMDHRNVSAMNGLGKLYRGMRDWNNSKKWFKKALNIDPENDETNYYLLHGPDPEVVAVLKEAADFQRAENYDEAVEKYERALKIYKGTIQAFRGLGQVAFRQKNWGATKAWFDKLLEVQPLDVEAKYNLGIAYRETGKLNSFLIKQKHFDNSEQYLESVIAVDSSYRDVLYQRALLERWRGNWNKALALAHKQQALKPTMGISTVGLVKFYQGLRHNHNTAEVELLLSGGRGAWVDFTRAEMARADKRFLHADSLYEELLRRPGALGRQVVYLSLLRSMVQQDKEEQAGRYFNQVLENLQTEADADLLFEDCKYIFSDVEYDHYLKLRSVSERKGFFQSFWTSRNPTPSSSTNIRAVEHYRRLVYAEENYWYDTPRSAANSPDHEGALTFPKTYWLNEELNDKGLIYIRHGEADEVAVTHNDDIANESWYYYQRADRQKMIFHFLTEALTAGGNWRLVPFLSDLNMIRDRLGWDPKMDEIYLNQFNNKAPFTATNGFATRQSAAFHQLADKSRREVYYAMSNDFHTWDEKFEDLSVHYFVSSFQGRRGKSEVELYFAVPTAELLPEEKTVFAEMLFEHGAGLYDSLWRPLAQSNEQVYLLPGDSSRIHQGNFVGHYRFSSEPGLQRLTFYAKDLKNNRIGLRNFDIEVPDFSSGNFAMSDLMLAYDVRPAQPGAPFSRGGISYMPNPTMTFRLSDPIFIYYEAYGLGSVKGSGFGYKIEIRMTQLKKTKSGIGRLFSGGKRKKSISLSDERQTKSSDSVEFTSFDVSNLEEGRYELKVSLRDLGSGKSISKSVEVELAGE